MVFYLRLHVQRGSAFKWRLLAPNPGECYHNFYLVVDGLDFPAALAGDTPLAGASGACRRHAPIMRQRRLQEARP